MRQDLYPTPSEELTPEFDGVAVRMEESGMGTRQLILGFNRWYTNRKKQKKEKQQEEKRIKDEETQP